MWSHEQKDVKVADTLTNVSECDTITYDLINRKEYKMTQKTELTKEQIMTTLKNGKVSYRPIRYSGKRFESPFQARERLLKLADKAEKGKLEKVDLSVAFDRRQAPSKVASHKGSQRTISNQNQR